jgi:hypothetical protein
MVIVNPSMVVELVGEIKVFPFGMPKLFLLFNSSKIESGLEICIDYLNSNIKKIRLQKK